MMAWDIPLVWQAGLAGGVLIGLAAAALMALNGRIAGISGMLAGLWAAPAPAAERVVRAGFIGGLLLAGFFMAPAIAPDATASLTGNLPLLALSGLLVGFGTRLGSGCTSGHGVCGLARRSTRSLTAVLVFMTAGAVTVFFLRHGGY